MQYEDTGLDIDDILNLHAYMRGEVEYSLGEGHRGKMTSRFVQLNS